MLASPLLLSACATTHSTNDQDPFQSFNRAAFKFNEKLDEYFMKPVATFYNKVMPRPLNAGINNMFANIDTVPTIVNDLLQANFYQATSDTWRFGINTTIGLLGFYDVATHMGLAANVENFGLTLASWGWGKSDYLVIPFLGPNTIRGTVGKPVDWFFSLQQFISPVLVRNGVFALQVTNERAQLLKYQNVFEQAALDPYVFVRNAYLQRQAYLIKRNKELTDPYTSKDTLHYDYEYEDFEKI